METQSAFPTLSLCMIVKNEAQNLERCLRSVQGVVDEMVIVDTGSTDTTREIARAFGARVYEHAWQGDFAQARNVGLDQATGQWILHLDADEEVAPESRSRLKPLLAETTADGLRVCVRSFQSGEVLVAYFDSPQERLFRNRPNYRYEQPIHELIVNSINRSGGTLLESDLVIWHYGYLQNQVQGGEDRLRRNLQLLEQAVSESPQDAGQCARLGFSYYLLENYQLAYTYLCRALVELDASHFRPDFMETVLQALWRVAFVLKDYKLMAHCAKALQSLCADEERSVKSSYTLARSFLFEGERCWQQLATPGAELPELLEQTQTTSQLFQQAHRYYLGLRNRPELTASAANNINQDLQFCRARLAAAEDLADISRRQLAANETLHRLLEAEDIVAALRQRTDMLTPDLLALVRVKAKEAQAMPDLELAEGLDDLAAYIEQVLQSRASVVEPPSR